MIELRHLQYFMALSETLHFGRAAERLHISQPPLSRQIAQLEEDLGARLFERTRRSVKLSAAGERFQRDVKGILVAVERAKRNARAASVGEDGTLLVGFMFAAAYSVLPPLMRAYADGYPRVDVKLSETISPLLLDEIIAGRMDVGIMYPPDSVDGLERLTVYREPLVAVLPADHPLAAETTIGAAALAGESFIISPRKASTLIYDTIIDHCRRSGFTPRVRLETNFQQTIVNLVGEGLGVALVHRSMQSAHGANVVFKPLLDSPEIEVAMVWSRDNCNPCVVTFARTARAMWTQRR